jgi:hypothetical protein
VRSSDQRDMVLYLPDEILVVDNYSAKAWIDRYDFEKGGRSTEGKAGDIRPSRSSAPTPSRRRAIIAPANMPSWSSRRRKASARATSSKWCPGRNSWSAATASRRIFPSG